MPARHALGRRRAAGPRARQPCDVESALVREGEACDELRRGTARARARTALQSPPWLAVDGLRGVRRGGTTASRRPPRWRTSPTARACSNDARAHGVVRCTSLRLASGSRPRRRADISPAPFARTTDDSHSHGKVGSQTASQGPCTWPLARPAGVCRVGLVDARRAQRGRG